MATLPTDYNELKALAEANGYEGASKKKADLVAFLESNNISLPEGVDNISPETDTNELPEAPKDDNSEVLNTSPDAVPETLWKPTKITLKETVLGLWEKWETVEVSSETLKDIPTVWYK